MRRISDIVLEALEDGVDRDPTENPFVGAVQNLGVGTSVLHARGIECLRNVAHDLGSGGGVGGIQHTHAGGGAEEDVSLEIDKTC